MADSLMGPATGLVNSKLALADAGTENVLSGKKFYAGDKIIKTGSMPNNTGWSETLGPGTEVSIPKGYHPGTTKVSARIITASDVLSRVSTASIECNSNGNTDVGADKYIIGLVHVKTHRYPGDYTEQPGEMWDVSIYNSHTIASNSADGTRPYVTYRYIPV